MELSSILVSPNLFKDHCHSCNLEDAKKSKGMDSSESLREENVLLRE